MAMFIMLRTLRVIPLSFEACKSLLQQEREDGSETEVPLSQDGFLIDVIVPGAISKDANSFRLCTYYHSSTHSCFFCHVDCGHELLFNTNTLTI